MNQNIHPNLHLCHFLFCLITVLIMPKKQFYEFFKGDILRCCWFSKRNSVSPGTPATFILTPNNIDNWITVIITLIIIGTNLPFEGNLHWKPFTGLRDYVYTLILREHTEGFTKKFKRSSRKNNHNIFQSFAACICFLKMHS